MLQHYAMGEHVDYYISGVKVRGGHITHVRVHKALSNTSFAPHGIVQPRSTLVVNLRSSRIYKTLVMEGGRARPGSRVSLVEVAGRFYLRAETEQSAEEDSLTDDLGGVPVF